jgi:hypothetical protein
MKLLVEFETYSVCVMVITDSLIISVLEGFDDGVAYAITLASVWFLYFVHRLAFRTEHNVCEARSLVLGEKMLRHLLTWVQWKERMHINQAVCE